MRHLRGLLLQGRFEFFDRTAFSGWPALTFYSFGAHLLTCLVSLPLGWISDDPVMLATRILLVLGCTTLPWSVYLAGRGMAEDLVADDHTQRQPARVLAALGSCAITFWYLAGSEDMFGIGASSIIHGGLYPQLFAWHLLLWYCASLIEFLRRRQRPSLCGVAGWLAALLLTHTLSAVYAAGLGALACFAVPVERRHRLVLALALGVALPSFWLLPCVVLASRFTYLDIEPWVGDLLTIVFRYPLQDLPGLFMAGLFGAGAPLTLTEPFLLFLLPLFLLTRRAWRHGQSARHFFLIVIISAFVLSSSYVAMSVAFGLHYYRFASLIVLLTAVIASVAPLAFLPASRRRRPVAIAAIAIVWVGSIVAIERNPPMTLQATWSARWSSRYADDDAVVEFLQRQSTGRVLFEYFDDARIFALRSPHYIYSKLAETGVESLNGLFIQSSAAWIPPAAMMKALGGHTYLFDAPGPFELSADILSDLRSFGISHVVAASAEFRDRLRTLPIAAPTVIGPYSIFTVDAAPAPSVAPIRRELIGYVDQLGNLPFKLVSLLFSYHPELRARFELIELHDVAEGAGVVERWIVNGAAVSGSDRTVVILFPPVNLAARASSPQALNPEQRLFDELRTFANTTLIPQLLKTTPKPASESPLPMLQWEPDGQGFTLRGTTPSVPVSIAYSYFPYWAPASGRLFHAAAERMIFVPSEAETHFSYSRWHHWSAWLGTALSVLAVIFFAVEARSHPLAAKHRTAASS